jgi:hypothetical protein
MQQFDLRDDLYKSRPEWSCYSVSIEKYTPLTRRVILANWEFPDIIHNDLPITQLAVVVNSNLGIVDGTVTSNSAMNPSLNNLSSRSNVLSGPTVKQIIFNKGEDGKWAPVNGINTLEYTSKSMMFNFRLRMFSRGVGFVNVPLNPRLKWKLLATIV